MSFFKQVFDSVNQGFQKRAEKKRQEREEEDSLRRQSRVMDKIAYEKAFLDSARKAARIKAERDANKSTGLAKLRAMRKVEELDKGRESVWPKLSEYIHKNIQRREENLQRTERNKDVVKEMKDQKLGGKGRYIPFSDLKKPMIKY